MNGLPHYFVYLQVFLVLEFVDHFLKPLVPKLKSYVKDTTDFVKQNRNIGRVPKETLLVTLAVSSLYTNIPNQEGMQALSKALSKCGQQVSISNITFLMQLLRMVLQMNNFVFNGQHYLQIGGTAMGTRLAPSYANLFMGNFVYSYADKPLYWKRYIDDIFLLRKDNLTKFITFLNSCHPTIKFTAEISETQVPFLDTLVIKLDDGTLITDLYGKPTDSHNYLHYSSSHPAHCKKSLPHSQFLSIRRICTRNADYSKHVNKLAGYFFDRGYPAHIVNESAEKVAMKTRSELLDQSAQNRSEAQQPTFYTISTFHPRGYVLRKVISTNWPLLLQSCATRELHKSTLIFGNCRNKNLRNILVHSKITKPLPD